MSNAVMRNASNGGSNATVTLSPIPIPIPRDLDQRAALDLREEPEKGPEGWNKPAAARLHEEPGASRRPPGVFSDQEFRRLCKLVRTEVAAHPALDGSDLMEHLKCAAARARLAYDGSVLGRVLDVVQPRKRVVERHVEPPRVHWRDRCAHTPRCATPPQCELRAAKEGM